ncbi:IS3 family transposase [Piscirickettsia salmonis]|nr:IS3 family transposase [Piscirickettsia salmonis]
MLSTPWLAAKAYIRYYNHDRLHTANEYLSPVNFENSRKKVSCLT